MSTSLHALGLDDATALLDRLDDRLDAERIADLVSDAVSEIPIGDMVSGASRTVGAITDRVAGLTAHRQERRSRRVALVLSIGAVAAVVVVLVAVRRRRSADPPGQDDQRRAGAASPN